MNDSTSAPAGPGTRIWRSPLRGDVLVLLGVALFVQIVFPYRYDWPAHLTGGGGAMLIGAALAPRWLGRWTSLLGYGGVLALGWITEHLFFGPPDLVDVSFTLAGALVAYQATGMVALGTGPIRRQAFVAGVVLILVALAYRYGTSIGPV